MALKSPSAFSNVSLCVPRASSGIDPYKATTVSSEIGFLGGEDKVLIRVDRFGFSANNITYQALGDVPHFRYFDFHEAPKTQRVSSKSHGLIPVWGFGTVIWTAHKKIDIGEKVYGYFAPTRYLLLPIAPNDVNKHAFYVYRPHFPKDRRPYNQIIRCKSDPQYNPSTELEDLTMLYRPLFWTSYWCEDWLAASDFRGESTNFLISSASSKTAFCFAYLVRQRFAKQGKNVNIVGLTSLKNAKFTISLNLYDTILSYEETTRLSAILNSSRWIYVDVAGNDKLNREIRSIFATTKSSILSAEISLGLTNVNPANTNTNLSSWSENTDLLQATSQPAPSSSTNNRFPLAEKFFMPEWLVVRRTQLTVTEIAKMQNDAWSNLLRDGSSWVQIEHIYGPQNVQHEYEQIIQSGVGPEKGYVWSMWEESDLKLNRQKGSSKM